VGPRRGPNHLSSSGRTIAARATGTRARSGGGWAPWRTVPSQWGGIVHEQLLVGIVNAILIRGAQLVSGHGRGGIGAGSG
jgi:hypothetical protein